MDYFWILYLVTRLDSLHYFLDSFVFITGISFLMVLLFRGAYVTDTIIMPSPTVLSKTAFYIKALLTVFIVLSILKVVIPSKEDAYLIAAGVGLTELAKSETATRLASKSTQVIENWLNQQLPKKVEEKK